MANWFEELMSKDQRRTPRYIAPRLVAFFWDGGPPRPHFIRDISFKGLYLLTEQRWYPGTIITMTLQQTGGKETAAKRSIAVQVKVVREGEDGVGFAFMLPRTEDARRVQSVVAEGVELADRKTLNHFLRVLLGTDRALIDEHC